MPQQSHGAQGFVQSGRGGFSSGPGLLRSGGPEKECGPTRPVKLCDQLQLHIGCALVDQKGGLSLKAEGLGYFYMSQRTYNKMCVNKDTILLS